MDNLVKNGLTEISQLQTTGNLSFLGQPAIFKIMELEKDLLDFDMKLVENHEFRFQMVCIL